MRFLLLAALVLVAAPVLAQDAVVLRPGHPDLMTAGLTVDTETVGIRVVEPRAQDLGTVVSTVSREGDVVTVVTEADAPQAGMDYESTVTMTWPTLAPRTRMRTAGTSTGTTTYDGARVTGRYGRGDWDPLPFDITLPGPVFAPEAVPLVARALPFRAGYRATVPTFTADTRLRDISLTVVGEEPFTRADGTVAQAWVVEESSTARGSSARRHFVDAQTRALIATTSTARGGTEIVSEPVTEASLAALAAQAATPAVALRPGLDRLAVDALADYDRAWTVKLVEPQQQDIGTLTRSVVIDRAAGTLTVESETVIAIAGQQTTERSVMAYPSLAPISTRIEAGDTVVDLAYDGLTVTGTRTSGGETTDVDFTFDEPVFDPSFAAEAVRLVTLEAGYRGAYHTVNPSEGPMTIEFAVGEPEEVDGRTAWPVDVVAEGAPDQTFSVDAETREVLRIRLRPQLGVVVDIVPAE
ncbi:hypothetical protein [Rubrivirga sp.]|uniref:hypothetical protein n=1 Tax=Rubrivirga sp. TaxID=1885344 RepID=UPI003B5278D2